MDNAWMNRMGGNALMWGGLLWVLAIFLHPDVTTLDLATAINGPVWILVHWAYLIGDVLLIAGLFMLMRHLAAKDSGSQVGWATVALAGGVVGFTLDAVSTSVHLTAFPPAASAGGTSAQVMYDAFFGVGGAVGGGGFAVASLTLLVAGMVAAKEGWSTALAYGAVVIGGVEFLLSLIGSLTGSPLVPAGMATIVVNALMPASFATLGWAFAGRGPAAGGAGA